jgi:hypothetical protein
MIALPYIFGCSCCAISCAMCTNKPFALAMNEFLLVVVIAFVAAFLTYLGAPWLLCSDVLTDRAQSLARPVS